MAINVSFTWKDSGKAETVRGENVTVNGGAIQIWTEPHEIKPGGAVDVFIGRIVPLENIAGDAKVVRV